MFRQVPLIGRLSNESILDYFFFEEQIEGKYEIACITRK